MGSDLRHGKLLATIGSQGIVFLSGALLTVIVARGLGPSGRGGFAVVVAVAGVAFQLGHLSVEQANVYLWSKGENRQALVANSIVIGTVVGCASTGVLWLVAVLQWPITIVVPSIAVLAIAMARVPAMTVGTLLDGILVIGNRLMTYNAINVATAVLQCAAVALLTLEDRLSLEAVVVVWTVIQVIQTLAAIVCLRPRFRRFSLTLATRATWLGLRYHVGSTSLYLLFNVDILILSARVSEAQVGLYALAVNLAQLTYLATTSVAQVAMPDQLERSMAETTSFTAGVVRINSLVAGIGLVAICITSPLVVPAVFGASFAGSVGALAALAPGAFALAAMQPLGPLIVRLNRPIIFSTVALSAMVVNVLLNLILIPHFGIIGSGVASSIAYIMLTVAYVIWSFHSTTMQWRDLVPRVADLHVSARPARPVAGQLHAAHEAGGDR